MMLSTRVQVRRLQKQLRRPSTAADVGVCARETITDTVAVKTLEAKLLDLNARNFERDITIIIKELLTALKEKVVTTTVVLQLFLDTSWKDRNHEPFIAKVFHELTQEYEDDSNGLTCLLEKSCNNLLNILTLIGKPEPSDLNVVLLLANLYHLDGLPEDHRLGVESYLVDIAKAFWPYFMPNRKELWESEPLCNAVCVVLVTVGKILDNICPVNMERTFNKITNMLFANNKLSAHSRLQLMQIKECRAANWSLPEAALEYYKEAHSKFQQIENKDCNSCCSLPTRSVSPVSTGSVFSSPPETAPIQQSTELKEDVNANIFEASGCEVTVHKDTSLVVRIKQSSQGKDIDSAKLPEQHESTSPKSPLGGFPSPGSATSVATTHIPGQDYYSEENTKCEALDSESLTSSTRFPSPGSATSVATTHIPGQDYYSEENTKCEALDSEPLTSSTRFPSPGSAPSVATTHIPGQDYYSEENTKCEAIHSKPLTRSTSENSSVMGFGFPKVSQSNDKENINLHSDPKNSTVTFSENPNSGGFPVSSRNSQYLPLTPEEEYYSHRNTRNFSFSEMSDFKPPQRNGFHRSLSEGGFPCPGDRMMRPRIQRQTSYEKIPWISKLVFPVKNELAGEDLKPSSRLYLLSFATAPSAMERPVDLTMTPELEIEKDWLKSLILNEPKTVLDRFG